MDLENSTSRWPKELEIQRFDFSPFTIDRLAEIIRIQCANLRSDTPCSVKIANLPEDGISIQFNPGSGIEFSFSASIAQAGADRRNFFLNQWASALAIFVRAYEKNPELNGFCQLWLDDEPRYPGITFSGNNVSHLCLPDPVFLSSKSYFQARFAYDCDSVPWRQRRQKVFWRGATTGIMDRAPGADWKTLPRLKMCLQIKKFNRPDLFDVGISKIVQIFDHASVEEIHANNLLLPEVHPVEFMHYKHSIDIDGNVNSWPGLFTKLVFGNTILKVDNNNGYRQWYYDKLVPWKNFVPVSANCRELLDIVEWLMAHPERAEAIALSARALADELQWGREIESSAEALVRYVSAGISYAYTN